MPLRSSEFQGRSVKEERGEEMARICPLFSGSTGNSYYIGTKSAGVLVDAGRSAKQMEGMLRSCEIDPLAVAGILITHEHTDHISGVRVLAKRYQIPVFASRGTLTALSGKLDGVHTYIVPDGLQLAGMTIQTFHTPHDCAESLGYRIKTHDDRVITVATDIGHLSEEVINGLLGADFVVLESNHDTMMLRDGSYPYYLQRRILSDRGHLCNDACAAFLVELAKTGTTRFLLAHLSRENNTRALALETALSALTAAGFAPGTDFILDAARESNSSGQSIIF